MATKLTFWDNHNVDYPIHALFCGGDGKHKAKYLKAIYQLDDSALPDSNEFDLGIFQVGYGDNTLNNKGADPEENLYARANPKGSFGMRFQMDPKFSKKGNPIEPRVYKVKDGVTLRGYSSPLRYPDKLLWVIHKESDGSVWLYRPQVVEKNECHTCYGRGTKAYNITGKDLYAVMDECGKDGYCYKDIIDEERYTSESVNHGSGIHWTNKSGAHNMQLVKWSKEFDGKNIMALCIVKPKMTFNEIMNVITNEGGTVDPDGTIHAATE